MPGAGAGPEFRSYVFLLDAEGVQPLQLDLYVALVRGEARMPERAGHAMRLADWHVRLEAGEPVSIANEWYGWVRFYPRGALLTHEGVAPLSNNRTEVAERDNVDTAALPGPVELEAMGVHVFGPARRPARPDAPPGPSRPAP